MEPRYGYGDYPGSRRVNSVRESLAAARSEKAFSVSDKALSASLFGVQRVDVDDRDLTIGCIDGQTTDNTPHIVRLQRGLHGELNAIRKQKCFLCSPFYGRACRWAMLGEIKT